MREQMEESSYAVKVNGRANIRECEKKDGESIVTQGDYIGTM